MRGFDYSPFYRATVGFDRVFDLLDNVAGQTAGKPEVEWGSWRLGARATGKDGPWAEPKTLSDRAALAGPPLPSLPVLAYGGLQIGLARFWAKRDPRCRDSVRRGAATSDGAVRQASDLPS